MPRTYFHSSKGVRVIEVLLYKQNGHIYQKPITLYNALNSTEKSHRGFPSLVLAG